MAKRSLDKTESKPESRLTQRPVCRSRVSPESEVSGKRTNS